MDAFPDFYICTVGANFAANTTYEHVVVACEFYTVDEWKWYHAMVKRLCKPGSEPHWTS